MHEFFNGYFKIYLPLLYRYSLHHYIPCVYFWISEVFLLVLILFMGSTRKCRFQTKFKQVSQLLRNSATICLCRRTLNNRKMCKRKKPTILYKNHNYVKFYGVSSTSLVLNLFTNYVHAHIVLVVMHYSLDHILDWH